MPLTNIKLNRMELVLFDIEHAVARITINRPEKFNAMDRPTALLLQAFLKKAAEDPSVRCIYLTGSGKAFSAGQDLGELLGDDAPGFDKILSEHYNPIVKLIRDINKPVVAAVNGVAAGAGANIALCCDVVVAADHAAFIQAFSKIGLIPDSGGTYFLPRLIGFQKASALMMFGDKVTAAEAEKMGMVYKVFPAATFLTESLQLATQLANMPTTALGFIKQALNKTFSQSLEQQLLTEDELQFQAALTADYAEGVTSFVEKRAPVFKGN